MKKLILFILIPFFIACSDDDSNNINSGSFLADYNGVIWLEDGNVDYDYWWIFTPNGVSNAERVGTEACDYVFEEWGTLYDDFSIDIDENSSDRLVVTVMETNDNGDEYFYSISFTVSNNGNTLTATYSDDPGYSETYSRSNYSPCG